MEWQTRTRFNEAWEAIIASKRGSNRIVSLSCEEYQERLRRVKQLKETLGKDKMNSQVKDHLFLQKYDIIIKGDREWLVKPQENVAPDLLLLYVSNDQMFDVLHEVHINTNHGKKILMYKLIRTKYCNVTNEAVRTYLRLCNLCNPRQVDETRTIASGKELAGGLLPMLPRSQSRVNNTLSIYFGFVDMYRYAQDGYSCIMVTWDISTQYIHIVPLQSMDHVHVAVSLLEIYGKFGLPYFIDAPYDTAYISSIIDHIKSVSHREDCCIMYRSSKNLDNIISGWNTVQQVLEPWVNMVSFQRIWPSQLKYIQCVKNYCMPGSAVSQPSTISGSNINPLE